MIELDTEDLATNAGTIQFEKVSTVWWAWLYAYKTSSQPERCS
jgi:hypothetical protein